MMEHNRPVISSLYSRVSAGASSHPLSSVSLSSDGAHAVATGRDVVHVLGLNLEKAGNALQEVKSVRISQYFQAPSQPSGGAITRPQYPHVHDILSGQTSSVPTPTAGGGSGVNVTVTDVAWSLPQSYLVDYGYNSGVAEGISPGGDSSTADSIDDIDSDHPGHYPAFIKRVRVDSGKGQFYSPSAQHVDDSSIVAAAGSNGVVVAWHHSALLGDTSKSPSNNAQSGLFHGRRERSVSTSSSIGQPEAAFLAHSRAVNRLAWHSTGNRPYLLLTASQDGTVKLWDRRATSATVTDDKRVNAALTVPNMRSWLGFGGTQMATNRLASTSANNTTTSKWHCVTTYTPKCEAVRDIKWNKYLEDVFAMVSDNGTLCVYDIRLNRPLMKTSAHAGEATSVDWHPSDKYVLATGGGRDRLVKVWDTESSLNIHKPDEGVPIVSNSASYVSGCTDSSGENANKIEEIDTSSSGRNTPNQLINTTLGTMSPIKRNASGLTLSRHHKLYIPVHTLFVSSPITSISWQSKGASSVLGDSIIAVSTSPIQGANAGGNGVVGLWTCSRPYVPISIVEGHQEGAVTAFAFVPDTATSDEPLMEFNRRLTEPTTSTGISPLMHFESPSQWYSRRRLSEFHDAAASAEKDRPCRSMILSVGRDGQCLLQDFSLGELPILQVPKSTFALASLSPFQPGFGSLQIMSVHQNTITKASSNSLVFSVTDQGDAEDLACPSQQKCIDISPELTHISRFSEMYHTTPRGQSESKADLCRHNASVAGGLNRLALSSMWKTLAIILEGSQADLLTSNLPSSKPQSALSYLLSTTIQNLLLQRADAGDVQTCVVICQVMDVIMPPAKPGETANSALPDIGIQIIREWYLSYIDLLQQMCLFTQAASLIKNCKDPVIGALNQQSTTINESCPLCSKPLLGGESVEDRSGARSTATNRVCRSCRGKIGLCFLCHEPVKGVFVWCPGCGHGGHLDHALEWFGSSGVCPTGCGHKCNLFPASFKK